MIEDDVPTTVILLQVSRFAGADAQGSWLSSARFASLYLAQSPAVVWTVQVDEENVDRDQDSAARGRTP